MSKGINGSNDDLHKISADEVYPEDEDDDSLEREELEDDDENTED